jgi:hypothetical protein
MTRAPCRVNASAIAFPIPLEEPVIKATLWVKSVTKILTLVGLGADHSTEQGLEPPAQRTLKRGLKMGRVHVMERLNGPDPFSSLVT